MTLLADNDFILTLATFELLDETCAWLETEPDSVQVLATARYTFKDKRLLERYGNDGVKRARQFVEKARIVTAPSDIRELDSLLRAPEEGYDIDPGEALLFASTAEQPPDFLIATGDKRCLADLARYPSAASVQERLFQRIICVEYTLLQIIDRLSFVDVQERVWKFRACNSAVRQAFGWSEPAGEAGVRAGLLSFIQDLDEHTQGILITP